MLDVVVDIRVGSPTFGRWVSLLLADRDRRSVYVSDGLAHGFLVLQDNSTVMYLCSTEYNPQREHAICATDPRNNRGRRTDRGVARSSGHMWLPRRPRAGPDVAARGCHRRSLQRQRSSISRPVTTPRNASLTTILTTLVTVPRHTMPTTSRNRPVVPGHPCRLVLAVWGSGFESRWLHYPPHVRHVVVGGGRCGSADRWLRFGIVNGNGRSGR